MRLRAEVREDRGKAKHMVGKTDQQGFLQPEQLPVPKWVEISEEGGLFYLFYLDSEAHCFADTCHLTLAEAKGQAEFEFGIPASAWMALD